MQADTSKLMELFFPPSPTNLDGHDSLFVVLGQVSDELQQLISLLLGRSNPTPLHGGGGGGGGVISKRIDGRIS